MATITKIKAGQTLYDVKRNTGARYWGGKWSVWPVFVREVSVEGGYIIASWNHNPPRKMGLDTIRKLRVKPPK